MKLSEVFATIDRFKVTGHGDSHRLVINLPHFMSLPKNMERAAKRETDGLIGLLKLKVCFSNLAWSSDEYRA